MQTNGETSPDVSEQMLRVKDIARKLRCSPRQVYRLVETGRIPAPHRIGGLLRWSPTVIQRWIDTGCAAIQEVKEKMS